MTTPRSSRPARHHPGGPRAGPGRGNLAGSNVRDLSHARIRSFEGQPADLRAHRERVAGTSEDLDATLADAIVASQAFARTRASGSSRRRRGCGCRRLEKEGAEALEQIASDGRTPTTFSEAGEHAIKGFDLPIGNIVDGLSPRLSGGNPSAKQAVSA